MSRYYDEDNKRAFSAVRKNCRIFRDASGVLRRKRIILCMCADSCMYNGYRKTQNGRLGRMNLRRTRRYFNNCSTMYITYILSTCVIKTVPRVKKNVTRDNRRILHDRILHDSSLLFDTVIACVLSFRRFSKKNKRKILQRTANDYILLSVVARVIVLQQHDRQRCLSAQSFIKKSHNIANAESMMGNKQNT